jgi:hypothetical protein
MSQERTSFAAVSTWITATALLVAPGAALAQRHGGHGGAGGLGGISRPDGVSEADSLKDFHHVLAVQATAQQVAEFQILVKTIEAAKAESAAFLQQMEKGSKADDLAAHDAALDRSLEIAQSENHKFQDTFSPAQKSGLKEIVKRLDKAGSDLEQEDKKLGQSLDVRAPAPEIAVHAESLNKALADFYDRQLALGREMSITLATSQDLAFTLPQVTSQASIENQRIAVPVSGELSQIAAQDDRRTFKLELIADLSELQENIAPLLRAQLETSARCGERVAIRQAALTPSAPASLLAVQLHFERWTCTQIFGQTTASELAEGDGSVEIKLTAVTENPHMLTIATELARIDATGMMAEELRSGSLGEDLRDAAARALLAAVRAGSDFKAVLPPAVQTSAVIHSVRFEDSGVAKLSVTLTGQIEISNTQTAALASQINQSLSAEGTSR